MNKNDKVFFLPLCTEAPSHPKNIWTLDYFSPTCKILYLSLMNLICQSLVHFTSWSMLFCSNFLCSSDGISVYTFVSSAKILMHYFRVSGISLTRNSSPLSKCLVGGGCCCPKGRKYESKNFIDNLFNSKFKRFFFFSPQNLTMPAPEATHLLNTTWSGQFPPITSWVVFMSEWEYVHCSTALSFSWHSHPTHTSDHYNTSVVFPLVEYSHTAEPHSHSPTHFFSLF